MLFIFLLIGHFNNLKFKFMFLLVYNLAQMFEYINTYFMIC
jgi:hypothetical protein